MDKDISNTVTVTLAKKELAKALMSLSSSSFVELPAPVASECVERMVTSNYVNN